MSGWTTAAPGDLCVLLGESSEYTDLHRPDWQIDLQDRFGGVFTVPLHVTCHRLTFSKPSEIATYCREVIRVLSDFCAFTVSGGDLSVVYSDFRSNRIIKCHSRANHELRAALAAVDEVTSHFEVKSAFTHPSPVETVPITVIEGITEDATALDTIGELATDLFVATELVFSKIVAVDTYMTVDRLELRRHQ